eukprot:COSAG06_NODE_14197_length_1180_cov_1.139685_1_plen_392_part_11
MPGFDPNNGADEAAEKGYELLEYREKWLAERRTKTRVCTRAEIPQPLPAEHNSYQPCAPFNQQAKVCFGQQWLDEADWKDTEQIFPMQAAARKLTKPGAIPTIAAWCDANPNCEYRVAKEKTTACQLAIVNPLFYVGIDTEFQHIGCGACGGTPTVHLLTFWANAVLTFALVSRLHRCYEDYYEQYHRMLYFIQLTPWSTMKHTYRTTREGKVEVKQKHEHWGLLPTFDLDSSANIVAWNKLRLFLQTYEQRSSRRLQVSVVYLLLAWVMTCIYQATKAVARRGHEVLDIETIFVISSTIMLAVGLASILFTGKWINDITQIGFPHVLRVKQAELLDKTSHYLVEHDFWNGSFIHKGTDAHSRTCTHPACVHAYAHVHKQATADTLGRTFSG